MFDTQPDARTRIRWTINALFVRQHAMLAALTSINNSVRLDELANLVDRHVNATRVQLQRLQCVGAIIKTDLTDIDGAMAVDDLKKFAHDMARGMLDDCVDYAAVEALSHLAVIEHGLYNYARVMSEQLHENEIATLLRACEDEEETFIHRLSDIATLLNLGGTSTTDAPDKWLCKCDDMAGDNASQIGDYKQ